MMVNENTPLKMDNRYAKRAQRACDQCNQSRTRCSGEMPCRRCAGSNRACQYHRKVRKRGPKPRAQQRVDSTNCCHGGVHQWGMSVSSGDGPSGDNVSSPSTGSALDDGTTDYQSPWSTSETSPDLHAPSAEVCSVLNTAFPESIYAGSYDSFPFDPASPATTGNNHSDVLECRYQCLNPALPLLQPILSPDTACDLLDIFFADPETTNPGEHCPYILSPVIRKQSLLRQTDPRTVSNALLIIIIWATSHTAPLSALQDPTIRSTVTQGLFSLSMKLLRVRAGEQRQHAPAGWVGATSVSPNATTSGPNGSPKPTLDDVLSYVLLTCVMAGTHNKKDCLKWWDKAVSLVKQLGFNSEAAIVSDTCSAQRTLTAVRETHEERRRAYWLVYSVDRHLAFSFNKPLQIHDAGCDVLSPLPEWIWRDLDQIPAENLPPQNYGPPLHISGTGFFEYFLPLMAILGDIIELHSRSQHPRLGRDHALDLDKPGLSGTIGSTLARCQHSLNMLQAASALIESGSLVPGCEGDQLAWPTAISLSPTDISARADLAGVAWKISRLRQHTDLVLAYSQYMLWILHMLLSAQWEMNTRATVWSYLGSARAFTYTHTSTVHHMAARQYIGRLVEVDKDLCFIPWIFAVYLYHGGMSFLSDSN